MLVSLTTNLLMVIALAVLKLCELSVHIPVKQKTQQSMDEESLPTAPLQQNKEARGQSNKCHISHMQQTLAFYVTLENEL